VRVCVHAEWVSFVVSVRQPFVPRDGNQLEPQRRPFFGATGLIDGFADHLCT
jgi:hypothetical protein